MIRIALLFVTLFAFSTSIKAQSIFSVSSGDWNNPSTWSCGCVPTKSDNVVIKSGFTVKATPLMGAYTCKNLSVENGGGFEIQGVFLADASEIISPHLYLGRPTNANDSTDYLLIKPQFALSYNNTKRHANWVSWELSNSWMGTAERQNDFRPDNTLPDDWYHVITSDYTNSGFDRGHICPSADRTKTDTDNSATFLMTNIVPQAPILNRESWAYLEDYCRNVVKTGYKAYIIAGAIDSGGTGDNGYMTSVQSKINVPSKLYKVIVLFPELGSINTNSIVIAVNFPNTNDDNREISWLKYVTTATEIEKASGANFFNTLPLTLQNSLKGKKFDILNSGLEVDATVRMYNGKPLLIGPRGGCYYINANGNKTYVDRSFCGTE